MYECSFTSNGVIGFLFCSWQTMHPVTLKNSISVLVGPYNIGKWIKANNRGWRWFEASKKSKISLLLQLEDSLLSVVKTSDGVSTRLNTCFNLVWGVLVYENNWTPFKFPFKSLSIKRFKIKNKSNCAAIEYILQVLYFASDAWDE
jgi:hypothetical protein